MKQNKGKMSAKWIKKTHVRFGALLMVLVMTCSLPAPASDVFAAGLGTTEPEGTESLETERQESASSEETGSQETTGESSTSGSESTTEAPAASETAGQTEASEEETATSEVLMEIEGEDALNNYIVFATVKKGTITATSLNLRSGAGTNYPILTSIPKGTVLDILGQGTDPGSGKVWYRLQYKGMTGYASSDYVTVSSYETDTDVEFEQYMNAQGFPESYKESLRILHAQYPGWTFVAQHTTASWSDAVYEEYKFGDMLPANWYGTKAVSLIDKNVISSWKATEGGAYNWETGQWVTNWDGSAWAIASKEIVAYYMDPRNFLNTSGIFQFLDLSDISTASAQTVSTGASNMGAAYLSGYYASHGIDYPAVICKAGEDKKINPLAVTAILVQELGLQGYSKATISGTVAGYEGYYNYFNIGAYTDSQFNQAYMRGLWYAKGANNNGITYERPWNTREKAIRGGTQYFAEQYVKVGQETLYLKRFNVVNTNNRYNHQFSTDIQGAAGESKLLSKAYSEDLRGAALTFKIPVYKNMPSSASILPTDNTPPSAAARSFAERLYTVVLGRTPDSGGLSYWTSILASGKQSAAQVASDFVFSTEYLNKKTSNDDFVKMLYKAMMNRNADSGGLTYWKNCLESGVSRKGVFAGFVNSTEFQSLCKTYGVTAGSFKSDDLLDKNPNVTIFVTRMYTKCLERSAEDQGRRYWVDMILNKGYRGGDLAKGFFFSDEFRAKNLSNEEFVKRAYRTLLDREADTAGLNYWKNRLSSGVSRTEVLNGFIYSTEFANLCKKYGIVQ